jgi:hypothetical protein
VTRVLGTVLDNPNLSTTPRLLVNTPSLGPMTSTTTLGLPVDEANLGTMTITIPELQVHPKVWPHRWLV